MIVSNKVDLDRLLAGCRQGDRAAWNELVDVITPVIFSVCKRARLSRDESFDIFGQICYDLVGSISEINAPSRICAYVATITRRKIYRIYRRMQIFERISIDITDSLHGRDIDDPEAQFDEMERRLILNEAIDCLPERDGKLIRALFLDPEEPSYREISTRLGIPVASIGPTRMRVLRELQRILRKNGYGRQYFQR